MQLLLEQSAADSSAAMPENAQASLAAGNPQHARSASPMEQSGQGRGAAEKPPGKKQRKKSGSVERAAASEAAKQAEIWAAASDAAATAAAAAAAAAASAGASPATASVWPGRRPTDAVPQRGLSSVPQAEWRNQAESYRAASAGGPVAASTEAFRHSPKARDSSSGGGMFSAPPGSVMDAAASAPVQDALRQQASRQQQHAATEASPPPVPPTLSQHPLHPAVAGPVGGPGASPPQHPPAQQHRQQHGGYPRPAVALAGLPHQNPPANVTYMHMASAAATRGGGSADPSSAGDAVVPGYPTSQNVRPAAGELPGVGDVRGGGAGSGGVEAGLATTPRVTVPGFGVTAARAGLHCALPSESKVRSVRCMYVHSHSA